MRIKTSIDGEVQGGVIFHPPKHDNILFDLKKPARAFSLLFALHRAETTVLKCSPFNLTDWMDHNGWFRAVDATNRPEISQFLNQSPTYSCICNTSGRSAAHIICSRGHLELASELMGHGADFLASDPNGVTPLHEIFSIRWEESDCPKVIFFLDKLITHQPAITFNERTNAGQTPLLLNITHSNGTLVPYLLRHKVNLDTQNGKGYSALLVALEKNMTNTANLLLESGADMFLRTSSGCSALSLAKVLQNEELYQKISMSHEERRIIQLRNIIQEIIDTERSYTQHLEVIVYIFKMKFTTDLSLTPLALHALFSNVENLFQCAHQFLNDLQNAFPLPIDEQNIGQIFTNHMHYFTLYCEYCRNQTIAVKTLRILQSEPIFFQYLTELQFILFNDGIREPIEGFLIKPVQRICRYPLLLRELVKYWDVEADSFQLLRSVELQLGELLNVANEEKRKMDEIEEIFECFTSQGVGFSSSSRFIRQGNIRSLTEKGKLEDFQFFLFTDVFILALGTAPLYELSDVFAFHDIAVVWLSNDPQSFDIVRREKSKRHTFVLSCKEERDKLSTQITDLFAMVSVGSSEQNFDLPLQRPIYIEEAFCAEEPRFLN
jgi:ankyrin repeat protein